MGGRFHRNVQLFPEAIASALSMVIASRLVTKVEARILAILGLMLLAYNSYCMCNLSFDTPNSTITYLLLVRGLGFGLLMIPVQTIAMGNISKASMANASALTQTSIQVGTAIGITLITSIMQQRNTVSYADLSQQANPYNPNFDGLMHTLSESLAQAGIQSADAHTGALAMLFGMVSKQARLQAINDTMLVLTLITIAVILPTLFLRKTESSSTEGKPITMN